MLHRGLVMNLLLLTTVFTECRGASELGIKLGNGSNTVTRLTTDIRGLCILHSINYMHAFSTD